MQELMLKQYKEVTADKNYWFNLFGNMNCRERAASAKNSRIMKIILYHIGDDKTAKILDAGCGIGKLTLPLIEFGYDAIGIDYDPRLIDKVHDEVPEHKHRFKEMDARHLVYPDKTFSFYLSPGVVEHFQDTDQDRILVEAKRVLKDNGKLLLIVPYMNTVKKIKASRIQSDQDFIHKRGGKFYQYVYSQGAAVRLLEKHGFTVEGIELLGLHDTSIGGRKIIPPSMQDSKILLGLFGTTMCLVATKNSI